MPKYITCVECAAAIAAEGGPLKHTADSVALDHPNGCPYCRRVSDGGITHPQGSAKVKAVHDKQDELVKKQGGSRNCFQVQEG